MAGVVYLRTNRFEVKLEGITFKKKKFEALCKADFLFPAGKTWDHPPIVGLDVMCHPRDPSIILLLLSFGVGCVILRFNAGESLPAPIHRFLADKRIRFVGFGIPDKMDLFPFHELGLAMPEMDIGSIAARVLKDPKYKAYDLGDLARKVVGIKRMMGMTEPSSFERHAQIKCAICQLFVTSLIAMGLLGVNQVKRRLNINNNHHNDAAADLSPSKTSFLKNLNSLQVMAEGWFKPKKNRHHDGGDLPAPIHDETLLVNAKPRDQEDYSGDDEIPSGGSEDNSPMFKFEHDEEEDFEKLVNSSDGSSLSPPAEGGSPPKKPIKGILKCPSTTLNRCSSSSASRKTPSSPSPSPSTTLNRCRSLASRGTPLSPSPSPSPSPSLSPSPSSPNYLKLKRANSKGCNVRFKFH